MDRYDPYTDKFIKAHPHTYRGVTLNDVMMYFDSLDGNEDAWTEFCSCLECRGWGFYHIRSATDKNVGTTDARQDFMDIVYSELASDPDNNRANRIIWAADGYAESAKLGTNLAEVGTRTVRGYPIDAHALMEKVAEEYGERARDRLYQIVRYMPPAQPAQHIDADGTLWITVTDIEQVTRVIVDEDKSKFCRQFYMDAQPQRTGHWIPVGMVEAVGGEFAQWGSAVAYHKCSECDGQALRDDFEQEVLSKWCPHCGAKMWIKE